MQLTAAESAKLTFYRKRGSVFILAGAIGECLETILDRIISNRFKVSFGSSVSPDQALDIWLPTVQALSELHTYLENGFSDGLKNQEKVSETTRLFSQIVATLRMPYASFFDLVKNSIET